MNLLISLSATQRSELGSVIVLRARAYKRSVQVIIYLWFYNLFLGLVREFIDLLHSR
jgi:hypothetical protein